MSPKAQLNLSMYSVSKDSSGILWYNVRTKYYKDSIIYPSSNVSIIENFRQRLFSQDRTNKDYQFPIRLIHSIFLNAEKIQHNEISENSDNTLFEHVSSQRIKLENAIDTCVGQIQICVSEPCGIIHKTNDSSTVNSINIWNYPIEAVRELGFKLGTGEIFIKLFRDTDNIRQIYVANNETHCWEKVTNIRELKQLHIHHDPSMKDILRYNMPDLIAIKKISDMDIFIDDLNAKDYNRHINLWKEIFPILDELLRETLVILAQYNLILLPQSSHRK